MHDTLAEILDHLHRPRARAALIARFELQMLAELGFGLDLDQCAATGATAELVYVSPKSGRAVSRPPASRGAIACCACRRFCAAEQDAGEPESAALSDAFALTGFFLERHVLEPRGLAMHDSRASFIAAVLREETRAAS